MHTKFLAPLVLSLILAASCQNNETKKAVQIKEEKTQKQHKQPKAAKQKKLVPLTDQNLKAELTAFGKENTETLVLLKTPKGSMKIKLYENTPLHRANFIRLIKNDFYKNTLFYRVMNNFMIQGGDSDDWERQSLKRKMGTYTLPAEFRRDNIHKKGAVSMARQYENNPEKRSVSFEFFIVQGTKYTPGELLGAEKEYGIRIAEAHKETYCQIGGCPHLDGQHTVFGEVIEGLEVLDSIAAVRVDEANWPIEDLTIEFQILE